jgi:multidrug transporter EmrE-like cation transporter
MKMFAWSALSVAVIANVIANVSLKFAVRKVSNMPSEHRLVHFIMEPWTWVGLCAGVVLLACYLLAIRDLGLAFSYAILTSVALVLVTISAAIAFQERLSPMTFLGIGLIVVGIAVLTSTELAK